MTPSEHERRSRIEPKRAIAEAGELVQELLATPLLTELEQGGGAPDRWQRYVEQRYLAARDFETLLIVGQTAAEQAQLPQLATAFRENLAEERGESVSYGTESHESWRQDFYAALQAELGLTRTELTARPGRGATTYQQAIEALVAEADPYELGGALLGLELSIPGEFKRVLKGLEQDFPRSFGRLDDAPSPEEQEARRRSRRYLEDHVHHDTRHYQEIVDALAESLGREIDASEAEARIIRGVEMILSAKRDLYEHLLD